MIYHTDLQGSDEWLASRRGVITGSRFRDATDFLKNGKPSEKQLAYARDVARERFGGTVPQNYVNSAMRMGTQEEPRAKLLYEEETGHLVHSAGFITTDDVRFGVSVDGLVGEDGVIEIKTAVSSNTLFKAIVEEDHSEYIDQCNGAMWLLGRKWTDLILWAPDLADAGRKGLHIVRIARDEKQIKKLEAALMRFAVLVDELETKLRLRVS
jgi:hypothetical protein